jgi:glycosyltransferase involved in cell wall biosynthesis
MLFGADRRVSSVAIQADQMFAAVPGGGGAYLRSLVPALAQRDPALDITLFHARASKSAAIEPWAEGLAHVELAGSIRSLYPRWNLTARPPLPPSLRSLDLVHAPSAVGVPPAGQGQKLVVTVQDLAFLVTPAYFPPRWRQIYRSALRATVRRADVIIAPSRNTAEDLLTRTHVDPSKVRVIPLAAALVAGDTDPEAVLARLNISQPYLLYVGTLEPRKNLIALIRAYRRVATNGWPHTLVLAGPLGWHQQSLLRELGLAGPGDVVLTGTLSGGELDALYRRADCFCYPSLYEGFGLPVLEAMARGVPTICSNTSSLPEVAGDAGVGVSPDSVREIAAAIESVLGDETLRHTLSVRGRARAERFSWDETARLTLQVYEKALAR